MSSRNSRFQDNYRVTTRARLRGGKRAGDVAGELTLNWGVVPVVLQFKLGDLDGNIELALKTLLEKGRLRPGNTVVVVSSINSGDQIVDAVQMRTV